MEMSVSLETVLNSRCSSDSDGDPTRAHWGQFDPRPLRDQEREAVISATLVPRFTRHQLLVGWTDYLRFAIEGGVTGREGDALHVESGMQQQAAHLACAALGLGACIFNLGKDGTPGEGGELGTARMLIQGLRPGYQGARWTDQAPAGEHPWRPGNLPDPARRGRVSFFPAREQASLQAAGRTAGRADLSQVLWAARGRTPHLVWGREWGLTIPTWAGGQDYTRVWVVESASTSLYLNWEADRPTHSLQPQGPAPQGELGLGPGGWLVVFAVNEEFKRALWEVGYMLIGALLQATALGISFQARMLDQPARAALAAAGVEGACAALAL